MLKTGLVSGDIGSAEFFERARKRLRFDVPAGLNDASIVPLTGDHGNDQMLQIVAQEMPIRPAAVLIPIVAHSKPTVLLTQRAAHLNDHAGQIAFPGGKIDAIDASPLDAALREAHEEIGLSRDFIDPIGYLDLYGTGVGFRILPTVARVKPGFELRICEAEVDDVFEVPLEFLMDPANHQIHSKDFRGLPRSYYAMPFADRYIWGPRREFCACFMSGFILHDPSGSHRSRNFSDPVRGLRAVSGCNAFRLAGSDVVARACHGQAGAGFTVAHDPELRAAGAFSGASPSSTYVPAHIDNGKFVPGVEK